MRSRLRFSLLPVAIANRIEHGLMLRLHSAQVIRPVDGIAGNGARRRCRFPPAPLMEAVLIGRLVAAMRGLGRVTHAASDMPPHYEDARGHPTFPQGWAPDPDALRSGLHLSTPDLTPGDCDKLTS